MLPSRVVHCVPNTDMRNNHLGLAELARKQLKVKIEELRPNEFVVFINSAWTAYKMYQGGSLNTVLHYKSEQGDRLNAKAVIQSTQHALNGEIGYKKALVSVIEAEYKVWEES